MFQVRFTVAGIRHKAYRHVIAGRQIDRRPGAHAGSHRHGAARLLAGRRAAGLRIRQEGLHVGQRLALGQFEQDHLVRLRALIADLERVRPRLEFGRHLKGKFFQHHRHVGCGFGRCSILP